MIPYRFDRTAEAAGLQEQFATLAAGETSGVEVSVAGRLMLRRTMGKLAFGTLQDSSGRIQLFAPSQSTPEFDAFAGLSLGDRGASSRHQSGYNGARCQWYRRRERPPTCRGEGPDTHRSADDVECKRSSDKSDREVDEDRMERRGSAHSHRAAVRKVPGSCPGKA